MIMSLNLHPVEHVNPLLLSEAGHCLPTEKEIGKARRLARETWVFSADIGSFVSSKPFVVIGPGKRLFYVHKDLLAQSSAVLNSDVNRDMQERRLETIEILDVDGDIDDDTVMRFIEYVYSGDYSVPDPDVVQLQTDPTELQEAFTFDRDSGATPSSSKKVRSKKKTQYPERTLEPEPEPEIRNTVKRTPTLQSIDTDRLGLWKSFCADAHTISRPSWRPREDNDEREDFTGIFLCHARIYKFSDRYGCPKLMELAIQKLRLTLSEYRLYPARVPDVVELLRYTYAHTMDPGPAYDALRLLVLNFATCYFPQLEKHSSFHKLLQEGGSFPCELVTKVAQVTP